MNRVSVNSLMNLVIALTYRPSIFTFQVKSPPEIIKYDIRNGMFEISTEYLVKIKCPMDFTMYPFDTQICPSLITADKNLTYQEEKEIG